MKTAAIPGGAQGGVFANNVYNGYRQAEFDLGPSVTHYTSDWGLHKMLDQLQRAIAARLTTSPPWGIHATTPPIP